MKHHTLVVPQRMLAAVVVMACLAGPGFAYSDDTGHNGVDYAAMSEDIDVMARILTKAVGAKYQQISGQPVGFPLIEVEGEDKDSNDMTLQLRTGKVGAAYSQYALAAAISAPDLNIRGFYVPQSGVVFALDISVRTALVTESGDKTSPEDEWQRTEREVRKGETFVTPPSKESQRRAVVNPEAVELAAETLMKAVAKHGSNMEQLYPGETITLAVRFRASTAVPFEPERWFFTAFKAAPRRVVIQIPVEAIHDYAAGKIDPEGVVRRSQVTKY